MFVDDRSVDLMFLRQFFEYFASLLVSPASSAHAHKKAFNSQRNMGKE